MSAILLEKKPEIHLPLSLSVSKAKTFKDCARKFRFCYIEKLPRKEWEFHVFGKFLHRTLELFHLKLEKGNKEPLHQLMNLSFKEAFQEWKEKLTSEQKTQAFEILKKYLLQLAEKHKKNLLPIFTDFEKEFNINVDNKLLLTGYIDRIQIDPDGVYHVSDYKTSKDKKYLKKDVFQLLTYAFVICLKYPNVDKVRGSYIMLKHDCEPMEWDFSRDKIMAIEQKFLEYADQIETEKLYRPNPTPLCHFCDYLDKCDAGQRFVVKHPLKNRPPVQNIILPEIKPVVKYGKVEW